MSLEHVDDGIPLNLSHLKKFPKITRHFHQSPGLPIAIERNFPRDLPFRGRSWTLLRHVWRACCALQRGKVAHKTGGDGQISVKRNNHLYMN